MQTIILVDKNDRVLGYALREDGHRGCGKKHRAFVTLLFDSQNRVLLQRRRHRLFDDFWDLTAISHPLHLETGDESYQIASDRALKKEMGIGHVAIKKVGAFNYFARDGKHCENEYCAILVGHYDGDIKPNKREVYEIEQVAFENFIKDVEKNPKKYTPWARLAANQMESKIKVEGQSQLQTELGKFLEIFAPYAKNYFEKKIKQTNKYSPLITKFYRDLGDFSSRGKKMRAFLVWLGYRTGYARGPVNRFPPASARSSRKSNVGQQDRVELRAVGSPSTVATPRIEDILPICLAFEMTQSFLLIHDDIIDNAPLRRGKPTIHKIYGRKYGDEYGRAMAIVLGDIACVELFDLVVSSDFEPKLKILCVRKLINVLLETTYGQAMDIENAYIKPTLEGIYKVTDLKSARYSFVGPLTIGAALGEVSRSQLEALAQYGRAVGLAFQIQDDILGVFGKEEVLGKSILSDMREGKNTILVYKTRELASSSDKKILEKIWGNRKATVGDLAKVRQIIERTGALAWCRRENLRLVAEAKKNISKITKDKKLEMVFDQIANFVVSRGK